MTGLRRGFKSWCENASMGYRREFALSRESALDPRLLARKHGIPILEPRNLPGLDEQSLRQLLEVDPSSWSAATLSSGDRTVIILNPTHDDGRTNNTIAHELAHVILEHKAAQAFFTADGLLMMKHYDKVQEEEADCFAATLLVPREALLALIGRGVGDAALAAHFGVSADLLRMRKNKTGVERQLGRGLRAS